jgi:hypothetical protein
MPVAGRRALQSSGLYPALAGSKHADICVGASRQLRPQRMRTRLEELLADLAFLGRPEHRASVQAEVSEVALVEKAISFAHIDLHASAVGARSPVRLRSAISIEGLRLADDGSFAAGLAAIVGREASIRRGNRLLYDLAIFLDVTSRHHNAQRLSYEKHAADSAVRRCLPRSDNSPYPRRDRRGTPLVRKNRVRPATRIEGPACVHRDFS